ncbi:hypothetical protein BDN72DRAFT_851628 [Pluteus cervinus]|uniref:Uncharacterized protein n=1 Tax=Pluteus cervinus TaxID=181527 RepID=A0ACD2ZYP3_9AGAR|nr:hypothetical protein BDN72DRAFT_851628 [Pluteus cervinus]
MSVVIGPTRLARSTAAVNVLFWLHLVFNFPESCHCATPPTLSPPFISNVTGIQHPRTRPHSAGNGFRAGSTTAPWLLIGSGRSALKLEWQHLSKKSPWFVSFGSGVGVELEMTRIVPLLLVMCNTNTTKTVSNIDNLESNAVRNRLSADYIPLWLNIFSGSSLGFVLDI